MNQASSSSSSRNGATNTIDLTHLAQMISRDRSLDNTTTTPPVTAKAMPTQRFNLHDHFEPTPNPNTPARALINPSTPIHTSTTTAPGTPAHNATPRGVTFQTGNSSGSTSKTTATAPKRSALTINRLCECHCMTRSSKSLAADKHCSGLNAKKDGPCTHVFGHCNTIYRCTNKECKLVWCPECRKKLSPTNALPNSAQTPTFEAAPERFNNESIALPFRTLPCKPDEIRIFRDITGITASGGTHTVRSLCTPKCKQ
jgi:hypothetical protein